MLEHDAKVLRDGSNATYKDVFLGKTIQDNLRAVDDALAQVKVCDPAIGSGAFPVGMMTEIVRARKVLVLYRGSKVSNYDLKRDTILNSLYGVDLDPGAIEIAKLRLWLSLVVDEENFDNIQALPNLDYKIMQGNSLLQSYEGIKLFKETLLKTHDNVIRRKKQLQEELANLQNTYKTWKANAAFAMSPDQKKAIEEEIKKKEGTIKKLEATSKEQAPSLLGIESKAAELAEQLKKLHADFFRSASPADKKKIRTRIEELEWQLIETSLREQSKTGKLAEIQKLQKANVKPYFLWKLHFSDVFTGENDGFDIVIANPPYGAELSKSERAELKKGLTDTTNTNTAAVFIDQAKNSLINATGTLTYIVPKSLIYSEKWLSLAKSLSLSAKHLVDVEKAFEGVKLEQVMFVYNKSFSAMQTYTGHKFKNSTFIRSSEISKVDFDYFGCWICDAGKEEINLARKLKSQSIPLGEISTTKRGFGLQKSLSETGKYHVIGGKNISRYAINGAKGYLAASHVEKSANKFAFLMQPKIVSQDLIAHVENPKPHIKITACFDAEGAAVGLDTVQNTIITSAAFDPLFILGLLNSKLISWYTYNFIYCGAIRTMHFDNFYVGKIPIINVNKSKQAELKKLVAKISQNRSVSLMTDVSDIANEIDEAVYDLYGLSAEERNLVENASKGAKKKAA
jgi:predicted RNA methylase